MISKLQITQNIKDIVEFNPGLTGVDLALKVMTMHNPAEIDSDAYVECVNELVSSYEIQEHFFILDNQRRGFFFPKETRYVGRG